MQREIDALKLSEIANDISNFNKIKAGILEEVEKLDKEGVYSLETKVPKIMCFRRFKELVGEFKDLGFRTSDTVVYNRETFNLSLYWNLNE